MNIETISKTVQVLSVVAGVVISVLSFNATHQKDPDPRNREIAARRMEAARPFLELRQKLYMEALKTAAVLSTPDDRKKVDLAAARRRFRELYVSELSMVEPPDVEGTMVALAQQIDPDLLRLSPAQRAAYNPAHALRDTFSADWGLREELGRRESQR